MLLQHLTGQEGWLAPARCFIFLWAKAKERGQATLPDLEVAKLALTVNRLFVQSWATLFQIVQIRVSPRTSAAGFPCLPETARPKFKHPSFGRDLLVNRNGLWYLSYSVKR